MSHSIPTRGSRSSQIWPHRDVEIDVLRRCWANEREQRLRASSRLRVLMDLLPSAVLVLSDDRTVIDANVQARRLYGDDIIGTCWQGHAYGREQPVGDETVVVVDVARARKERLELLGASQAALAHQIRTPLTVAGLSVEQVLATAPGDAVQTNLARVQRSLTAIERHISNALVFVRGELSERVTFSLLELAEALQEAWQPMLGDPAAWWRNEADLSLRTCGDLPALVSALTNVVDNALAIGGSATRVVVTLKDRAGRASLSIADDGPGMSPSMLARAREPFVSDRPGGTGLGLAITDAVVRAHGGEVLIESAPASGTRVTATLPLLEGEGA